MLRASSDGIACPELTWLLKGLCAAAQPWLKRVVDKLPEDEQAAFKEKSQGAIKLLLGKIKELQLYGPDVCAGLARVVPVPGCAE